ncbi:MAG: DUF5615 family PIN-like protein [Candidatus Marinimicrobia bacterium]|nr:DUF5615 family PIN-like protein [Candidatus Neomarinimicrobiota bacterium]
MRFLVDENVGPSVADWLTEQRHDVFSVYKDYRGENDTFVLEKAQFEDRILITSDKDFGEIVFRKKRPHSGVILLRLANEQPMKTIAALRRLLDQYADQLAGRFVVVTETFVRIAGKWEE